MLTQADFDDYFRRFLHKSQAGWASYAYLLYVQASSASLDLLLLGQADIRQLDNDVNVNFGNSYVELNKTGPNARKKQGAFDKKNAGKGSILNEKEWWAFVQADKVSGILINDAWILGGIHTGKPFYLTVEPESSDALIWDTANKRPTVLGREILGLITFGYKYVHFVSAKGEPLELIFKCEDKKKAAQANLETYFYAAADMKSADALRKMLASNRVTVVAAPFEKKAPASSSPAAAGAASK